MPPGLPLAQHPGEVGGREQRQWRPAPHGGQRHGGQRRGQRPQPVWTRMHAPGNTRPGTGLGTQTVQLLWPGAEALWKMEIKEIKRSFFTACRSFHSAGTSAATEGWNRWVATVPVFAAHSDPTRSVVAAAYQFLLAFSHFSWFY